MIRSIFHPKSYGEAISYLLAALIYGSSAFTSILDVNATVDSYTLTGNWFQLIQKTTWLYLIIVILTGMAFSWIVNQFCKNHKILGAKTNVPIVISALSASLTFHESNALPWLLISIFIVFLFDAVFSAQEQEKNNLSGILLVGTLIFSASILNPLSLWYIPVILFAFGLFLFFSLKRFSALLLAVVFPMFILWSIFILAGKGTHLADHFSTGNWFNFHLPGTRGVFFLILKIFFLLPFILGWFSVVIHYGQNAAKQRKIQSVVLLMGVYLFPISEFTGSESSVVQGLTLIPLVLANSAYFARALNARFSSFIFILHVLAWTGLSFYSLIEPLLIKTGLNPI